MVEMVFQMSSSASSIPEIESFNLAALDVSALDVRLVPRVWQPMPLQFIGAPLIDC
jgi:hypothetical protein